MFSNTYSNVTEELGRLHLGSPTSQQYSPGGGKKVAPLVPPKPKKSSGQPASQLSLHDDDGSGQAMYGNVGLVHSSSGDAHVSGLSHGGVEDYYAVNAPAPGTVGVASARINHAYTGGGSRDIQASSAGSEFSGIVIPGTVYTSSTGQVPTGGMGGNPNYIPPPPQPAHSYTPTSRVAVPMSAQPLYSNTASQPIYNNSPRPQQHSYTEESPPPPLPTQPPPTQAQATPTYANLSTNGAAYPPPHTLYANVDPTSGKFSSPSF
nr:uncharacterized protein LOC128686763 [Cherax quadricarinatus]